MPPAKQLNVVRVAHWFLLGLAATPWIYFTSLFFPSMADERMNDLSQAFVFGVIWALTALYVAIRVHRLASLLVLLFSLTAPATAFCILYQADKLHVLASLLRAYIQR